MALRTIESKLAVASLNTKDRIVSRKPYYGDVVVVGFAELTPHGDAFQTRQAMLEGKSAPVKMMKSAEDPKLRNPYTRFYAPLADIYGPGDPVVEKVPSIYDFLHPNEKDRRKELSYNAALNIVAGRAAIKHAGLLGDDGQFFNSEMLQTHLVAVMMASGYGPADISIDMHEIIKSSGPGRIRPRMATNMFPEQPNYRLIQSLGLPGSFPLTLNAACASSSQSIAMAIDKIREGYVVAVAGGVEGVPSLKEDLVIGAFTAVRALSQRNEYPGACSRPFDDGRDGFLASSGVGAVVLAQRDWAEKMGLTIYAKINRHHVWNDANAETTQPDSNIQARELTRMLLIDEERGQIVVPDCIACHATSTPLGDRTEISAYKKTFGRLIYKNGSKNGNYDREAIYEYTPKSATGHMLGASGADALNSAVWTAYEGIIPPIGNLENPQAYTSKEKRSPRFKYEEDVPVDMLEGVNFVVGEPKKLHKPVVLVGNQGFGSHNAYILVEPV
ncbi:hypothetical protein HYU95_06130 [Candidatus Daviesbacteria bacterium]|nr:hypothetical protein [Candidatus Daviesbacteria bacterium]